MTQVAAAERKAKIGPTKSSMKEAGKAAVLAASLMAGGGAGAAAKIASTAAKAAKGSKVVKAAKAATPKAKAKAAKEKAASDQARRDADDWANLRGKYAMPKRSSSKPTPNPKQRVTTKKEEQNAARYVQLEKERARRAEESMRARRNQNPPRTKSTPYRDRFGNTGWR